MEKREANTTPEIEDLKRYLVSAIKINVKPSAEPKTHEAAKGLKTLILDFELPSNPAHIDNKPAA